MTDGMQYEKTPIKKLITRKGGKVNNMTKNTKAAMKTPSKSYDKTRGEHVKDIVIAILVAGVIAFVVGVHYSDTKTAQLQNAVSASKVTASVPAPSVKK